MSDAWSEIIRPGRIIIFVPDSDYFSNPKVYQAGNSFIKLCLKAGALVKLVNLSDSSGKKLGADDFLVEYGSEEFRKRCSTPVWEFSNPPNDTSTLLIDDEALRQLICKWVLCNDSDIEPIFQKIIEINPHLSLKNLSTIRSETKWSWDQLRPVNKLIVKEISIDSHIPRSVITRALAETLISDGRFFLYGKELLFIRNSSREIVSTDNLPGILTSLGIECTKTSTRGNSVCYQFLSTDYVKALFYSEELKVNLKEITLFTDHPTYTSDWELVHPGYNEKDKIFYVGSDIAPISSLETIEEITKDFLFKDKASLCNFVAILLTVILRNKYQGDKPMAALTGNRPGLGKSLSAKVASIIADGKEPESTSFHFGSEELEKQIGARVTNRDVLLIDNVKSSKPIESMILERLITDQIISFRILGLSKTLTRPNSIITFITMNDALFCRDLISRALPIQFYLDDTVDVFEKKFTHDSLLKVVSQKRNQILGELCGMVEKWKKAGKPKCRKPFRFRDWTQEIGGILEVNEFTQFLDNLAGASSEYDLASNEVGLLFCNSLGIPLKAESLVSLCKTEDLFVDVINARRPASVLSNHLKRYINKKLPLPGGGFFILKDGPIDRHNKVKTYLAEKVVEKCLSNQAGLAGIGGFSDFDETRVIRH